jgi:hypothetical protein
MRDSSDLIFFSGKIICKKIVEKIRKNPVDKIHFILMTYKCADYISTVYFPDDFTYDKRNLLSTFGLVLSYSAVQIPDQ